MTISRERRRKDQDRVLITLATEIGDEMVSRKWWDIDRQDFEDLIPTTWAELEERGLLRFHRRTNPPPAYELTEEGWVEGLRLAGFLDREPFRARCVDLVKFFKAQIAGRKLPRDTFVSQHAVGKHFSFPWVLNVLHSRLLEKMFPGKRLNARWDETSRNFRVPRTFGMLD